MSEAREALIRYRLERASATLTEAQVLAQQSLWNGCVNRLYYACFYAITALLLRRGLSSAKHSGIRSLFNREFVHKGVVAPDLGALYNALFQNRTHGDYADFARFDEATVRPWLEETPRFISEISKLAMQQPSG